MIALLNRYFKNILRTVEYSLMLQGMTRAANEMYRLGYYKEYESMMKRIRETKI
jgi:hypothetical protein